MARFYADRVRELTSTTGTGDVTASGALDRFRTFSGAGMQVGDTCGYAIEGVALTGEFETGIMTMLTSSTFARTTVLSSSNAGALVSFTSGTKQIGLVQLASDSGSSPVANHTLCGGI